MSSVSLLSLSTNSGSIDGGYSCTLTCVISDIAHTFTVTFGAVLATSIVVVDNNTITCVVPAHAVGLLNVILTDTTASLSSTLSNSFTFLNPGDSTLGLIREQCQERADMVNSQFITNSEWNKMISNSYKELYDILVEKFGDDYFVAAPYTYTTGTNQQLYPLPTDFYKLLGAEIALNTGNPSAWVTLKKIQFIDRNRFAYPNIYTFYGITNLRYRINGSNLMLVPITQAGQTVRIWYIPRPSQLINDGDIVDGVSGWEEYIITDVCIKAWAKQESDASIFLIQKQKLLDRIEAIAQNRDAGEAEHVSDTKSLQYGSGTDGYGSGTMGWF